MTKKDFELIAQVLKKYNSAMQKIEYKITGFALLEELTFEFSRELKKTNERFDIDRFLKASGIKTE